MNVYQMVTIAIFLALFFVGFMMIWEMIRLYEENSTLRRRLARLLVERSIERHQVDDA